MARLPGRARRHRSLVAGRASAAAADVGVGAPDTGPGKEGGEEAPRIEPDLRAAAFFDVDNTILRGAAIFYLARGLYSRSFFRTRDIARFGWRQAKFRLVGTENPEHIAEARASALAFIEGHSVAELTAICEEVFEEVLAEKVWPGTRALAEMHLAQGQRVWIVTAAPIEAATIIAHRLGLTGALGTVAEQVDGVYTGRLVGDLLHGPAKAEAVRALADREHLDLTRCSAYSDSANDLPLLSLVGNPCAINPDRALRERARAQGWLVRDFRGRRRNAALGAAAGVGAASGAVAAGMAVHRRRR